MNLEVKKNIENLVNKYLAILTQGKTKSYNEAQTRNEFIEPLFEYLGWDMRNLRNEKEVLTEESTSKGRIDLSFRLNSIPVMFLEAKALKVDLDDWKWAEQAINYSWNKGVTWAVLTDFESIKIFNAEIAPKGISENLFFEINCRDYINKFDQLWLLSREGFKQGLLTQEAQKWGKITKRKQVGEKLFEDLTAWRSLLSKGFAKKNKLGQDELDEGVQRVLDRLIFVRAAEDRDIEPNILLSLLRSWKSEGHKGKLYHLLVRIFRQFDDGYNSKIFAVHYSEEWSIDDDIVTEVVKGLYSTKDGYRYDFAAISADILGGIYEQYLGHVLKQAKKSARVTETHKKRKSQGIYYTPHYIVDFIVKETLGEVLKNIKPKDISKIKVLDPACGSGSFLTAAYDEILNYYEKHSAKQTLFTKFDILKENIHGVDLDTQAVEITQLNLLLKALSQKARLPTLQHNIRVGNSLISGNEETLKPYFAGDWKKQKPFNWQEEFKDVFKQGGFDVIVGNPPYVAITGIDFNLRRTYEDLYKTAVGRFDLFMLFLEKSLTLLRKGGFLGFIIPNKFLTNNQSQKLRRYVLENGNIESILLTLEKVFASVNINNIVLIIQKGERHGSCKINEYKNGKIVQISKTENTDFVQDSENRFLVSGREVIPSELLKKITNESVKLGEIAEVKDGIVAGRIKDLLFHKEKTNHYCEPLLFGGDVNRYQKKFSGNFVDYRENFMMNKEIERAKGKRIGLWMRNKSIFSRPKILTRKTADKIIAVFDDENYYYEQTLHSTFINNSNYLPLYVLALFNSSLFRFYYQSIVKQSGTIFPQVRISLLKSLPIKKVSIDKQQKLASLVQKMLDSNKGLQAVHLHTDQNNSLEQQIKKLNLEIDEEIYKLYRLTKEEITLVEEANKK